MDAGMVERGEAEIQMPEDAPLVPSGPTVSRNIFHCP